MDWLFDNLGKLAPVVIFIIYMISSLKGKGEREESREPDPGAEERARKIQEEIRRKILARQRGEQPPTGRPPEVEPQYEEEEDYEEPEVVFDPEPEPLRPAASSPPVVQAPEAVAPGEADPYQKRRLEIEAKMEEAKRMQTAAREKASSILNDYHTSHRESASSVEIRRALREGLDDPKSLKVSVLLKEVLERPVGMR